MAAKTCSLITDFYVSSDDEKILDAAASCGYKKIVRPAELALQFQNLLTKQQEYQDVLPLYPFL